ncbi:MAG: hypothetical protein ACTSRG_01290 [Candidatus Helarchaeota archaeon]
MPKAKKPTKKAKSDELDLDEELVLEIIKREPRRPKFIARKSQILNQNQVVEILNRLEKKGLVDRVSQKAWMIKKA